MIGSCRVPPGEASNSLLAEARCCSKPWPHTFGASATEAVRLLVLHAPALDPYFRDLQRLWSGNTRPPPGLFRRRPPTARVACGSLGGPPADTDHSSRAGRSMNHSVNAVQRPAASNRMTKQLSKVLSTGPPGAARYAVVPVAMATSWSTAMAW